MAEVRPNCSAERSVEMAEPFGFGRTTFLAVRSFTTFSRRKTHFCVKILLSFFFLGHLHFHLFPKMCFCPSIWRIQPSSKCRDSTNKSSIESCQQRRFVSIFLLFKNNNYSNKNICFLGASPIHEIGQKKVCQSPEIKVTIGDAV